MDASFVTIDPQSNTPVYEQLRTQVIAGVKSGRLTAGDKLPTVRGLADALGLAANTVAKAYRALEHDEVIETRGRNGSFVSASGDSTHRQAQLAAAAYAERITSLSLEPAEALALVAAALGIR
jgi:DNA-binding transcriptional regulator YhcF (GntR family)